MTAIEILRKIEEHCGETLTCSRRMRFQIEHAIQHEIDAQDRIKADVVKVLDGFSTFNPKTQKTIAVSNK